MLLGALENHPSGVGKKSSHCLLGPCLSAYGTLVPSGTEYGLHKGECRKEGKSTCMCQLGFPENAALHWCVFP